MDFSFYLKTRAPKMPVIMATELPPSWCSVASERPWRTPSRLFGWMTVSWRSVNSLFIFNFSCHLLSWDPRWTCRVKIHLSSIYTRVICVRASATCHWEMRWQPVAAFRRFWSWSPATERPSRRWGSPEPFTLLLGVSTRGTPSTTRWYTRQVWVA